MGLYLLDYGAGNVRSLSNSLTKLGYEFTWVSQPEDFDKATSLIFPGVGAFETAILGLKSRGLFEPLDKYIRSGKPYFGICIGMQVLFQRSSEAVTPGLGIIPSPVEVFDDADKSVPHMGWNSADLLDLPADTSTQTIPPKFYYFVHSYRAEFNPSEYPDAAQWAYATTQYGSEIFMSMVRRDNVMGCQFHPEKSGPSGLALLDSWLRGSLVNQRANPSLVRRQSPTLKPKHDLTKRIIACMDVRTNDEGDLVVTKGDQYDVREKGSLSTETAGAVRNLGKPVALAKRYYDAGADELCLLNITSFRHSPLKDQPMIAIVSAAAESVFVPLTIGGGIKDTVDPDGTRHAALEVAGAYFRAGADKVSIGSEAVYAVERLRERGSKDGQSVVETIAHAYGRQAVVVSIDPKRAFVDPASYDGPYKDELVYGKDHEDHKAWWYQCTVSGGRELRDVSAIELAKGAETLGAGEILVNSIDRDGTGLGFDLDLLSMVRKAVKIPVVASSGAGRSEHFRDVFQETDVEAALAAGIFHREEVRIEDVKRVLTSSHINTCMS